MTTIDLTIDNNVSGVNGILTLTGDLDDFNAPKLLDAISELSASDGVETIVLALDSLAFVDSVGLGAIVKGEQTATDAGKSFSVVCSKAQIIKLFQRSGLISDSGENKLDVHESLGQFS